MKALFYLIGIVAVSFIITGIKTCGFNPGGIEIVLLYGIMFFIVHKVCKHWDSNHKKDDKYGENKDEK